LLSRDKNFEIFSQMRKNLFFSPQKLFKNPKNAYNELGLNFLLKIYGYAVFFYSNSEIQNKKRKLAHESV